MRLLMEISPERESLVGLMRGVELQRTKTVKAGKLLWCDSFPIWDTSTRKDAEAKLAERAERKGTSEAQKRLNDRKAKERLVQLVNANFGPGDIIVTCTYARGKQPDSLTRSQRNMRNFIARLRRMCEKRGSPAPAYVYVTEVKEKKAGTEYHHHMVLKADVTREEAEALWEQAGHGHANTKTVKRLHEGLIGIAKYMANQIRESVSADGFVSRHRWCASKGLRLPQAKEADRKISRRRVERIAEEMERDPVVARAHMERCYPGYEVLEMAVRTSKWVTGAYVRAVMVRRE